MGARMVDAIRNTEGCLGVRTGEISGGLNTIFAFFEDREAALRWYHHPMHRGLRGMMGGETPEGFVPLGDVPAGVPVLAVAAISFDGPPADPESRIPFSTISIELYTPVNGGLRINGGFAPDKFAELLQRPDAAEPDAP